MERGGDKSGDTPRVSHPLNINKIFRVLRKKARICAWTAIEENGITTHSYTGIGRKNVDRPFLIEE